MIIRNIKQSDNKALAGLIKAVFEEYHAPLVNTVYDDPRTLTMYEIFRTPRSEYFVVEDEGEVLGGCGYYPTEGLPAGYAELVKFYFSAKLRGKGMGKRLIRMVIQAAKTAGYENLYIESFPEFSFAVSMYEKNGFVHLPSRLGNSGHTATTIHMIKDLRSTVSEEIKEKMADNLTIHFGTPDDIQAIAQFQVDMAMESEGTDLNLDTVKRGVTHAMEDSNKGRYVIAYADGKAIGSLMLTREWSDWTDHWYLWIQSVYVAPEYRGKGIYKAMYNKVKETAEADGISTIRLYVDKTNQRAQIVYQKLGMQESHYLLYEETKE